MMPVYETSNKVAKIRVSKLKLAVYGTLFADSSCIETARSARVS
jgi:hypothetical protein